MKRITWWPQAWLGIVFSWAALVGWSEIAGSLMMPGPILYLGSIFWVIGYDTIYALQDIEDDTLVGVRSSARALGSRVKSGVGTFYALAVACWALALWELRPDPLVLVALAPAALHFGWQVATLDPADGTNALHRFRSNRFAGLLVFLACFVVGQTSF
jgi:4-hydroxybenzoate polyprenyltransferase